MASRGIAGSWLPVVENLIVNTVRFSGKESDCQYRQYKRCDLIPDWRRPPAEANNNPLEYSCLGNPMDRGAWRTSVHGVEKWQT